MSKLDELTIEEMTKQFSFIKIVVNSQNHEPHEIMQHLFYIIKDTQNEVDRRQREAATAERNRLNGKGYCGKASH